MCWTNYEPTVTGIDIHLQVLYVYIYIYVQKKPVEDHVWEPLHKA